MGVNLRVLHIITSLLRGGAERMLVKLLSGLDRSRIEFRVISLGERGPVADDIEALGIPIEFLDLKSGIPGLGALTGLWRGALDFKPHLIQGWMYHANLAASIAALPLWTRTRTIWGIRQSVSKDLSEEKPMTRRVIKICGRLSGFPSLLVYNSYAGLGAHTRHGYSTRCVRVVPNGFDVEQFHPDETVRERFRQAWGVSQEETVIGIVGRYHPIKDHECFLEAARLALADGLVAKFVLSGREMDGKNVELVGLINEKCLGDAVILTGERCDMPELIGSLDLLVSASQSEAFSNVIGEAMSCEVPCVVTDVGDSARIVGETGCVVPPGQPRVMADAWLRMLDLGKAGLREMGRRARQRIIKEYSLDIMTKRYSDIYQELTAGKEI